MTYTIFNRPNQETVSLQSVGHVKGTPAGELKVGDTMMWNFGETSNVLEIVKQTAKTIWVKTESKNGYIGERRFLKSRLVVVLGK